VDIKQSYKLGGSFYRSKPGNLDDYLPALQAIEKHWFGCACVPARENIK
jgi:glutaminase